jgi:membrane-bound lytic murein transglycosylase D
VEEPIVTPRHGVARALIAAAALLLAAACASPPAAPPAPPQEPAAPVLGAQAGRSVAQAEEQAARSELAARALERPLDAATLPPFEGEHQTVHEKLRGLPLIDLTVPPDDLWQRVRRGFAIRDIDNPLVERNMAYYAARPDYLQRVFERSRLYLYHIVDEVEKRGMPTELALLPIVESAFNPMAYSRAHASGLWQFIPPTGKRYSLEQNWWYDARRDIVASTAAALDHLQDLYDRYGDWQLALAAYNWGENGVARAIAKNQAAGRPTDFAHLNMPRETRNYLPKLQALKNIITNPAPFGIVLDPIPNQPYFTTVDGTGAMDVQLAAKLAEMPVDEFIALNPGFNRPLIPTSSDARIVLPADKVDVFHANLQSYDQNALVSWKVYHPQRGENLAQIARKFHVSLAELRRVNGIRSHSLRAPGVLVVPTNGAAAGAAEKLPIMYAPPIPAGGEVHVVKRGDTLWDIARHYGVSVDELRRWNRNVRVLHPGQRLVVYPSPSRRGRSAKTD